MAIESSGPAPFHNDVRHHDPSSSSEQFMRDEIEKLLVSAEDKVEKAFKSLDISLLELRKQLDTVREEMKDNFRNFKQSLEICRDNTCKTLEDLPTEHQFEITDFLHDIQTTTDDIVKTCESCKKVNTVDRQEFISLNKAIGTQTDNLIKYVPQVDGNFLLDVDAYRDEHNAQDMYGSLNTTFASIPGDNVHSQTLPGNCSPEGGTVKNISNNNGKKAARMSCGSSSGLENVSILNGFPAAPPSVLSPIGTMPLIAVNTQSNGANCTIAPVRYIFGSLGASAAQFNSPHGFCLGVNDEIIVADTNNHRIKVFEKDGTFKFQFGETGTQQGQLWLPRKVAVIQADSKFVVCDRGSERSRMQIFTKDGQFIKRIFITFIEIVTCLTVTNDGSIVVIDSVVPTVYFMSEDGAIISWFRCGTNVIEPSDVAIRGSYLYICDYKSHRVAVFAQDGEFQHHISDERVIHYPSGICISDAGDMLIGDSHGNRFHVACLSRDGVLQSELVCPFPIVARCCGLKITSDGYIVTVAKNNNKVLVLNTPHLKFKQQESNDFDKQ